MSRADLFEAIAAGDADRVRGLVGADTSLASARGDDGVSAVLTARYRFEGEVVEALLAAEPELDVFDAAALGPGRLLEGLLDADAALVEAWSSDGFQALHLAAFFGNVEGARLLLERGADHSAVARNAMRVQPLHSAAAAGQVEIARLLLERGADPNAAQEGGFRPLDAAVANGDEELRALLQAHGADPRM